METLKPREQEILRARHLEDDPQTLESLSHVYDISRERVRQIEARALEKVEHAIQDRMKDTAA